MFRLLLEFLVFFIIAMAGRAILGGLLRGLGNATRGGFPQQDEARRTAATNAKEHVPVAGELHKDPVCGMYVAESTEYQRRAGRETVYYCSQKCKEQDSVAARA